MIVKNIKSHGKRTLLVDRDAEKPTKLWIIEDCFIKITVELNSEFIEITFFVFFIKNNVVIDKKLLRKKVFYTQ